VSDLESAVVQHGFGVMHIHDLSGALRKKGFEFAEECKVFEICHPGHAFKVLSVDMRLNMALPCRVSVYTEKGKTQIGIIQPAPMLMSLSQDQSLTEVAKEVQEKITEMIDSAK
jgi:uncharacterized protein (DUF302 family)